MIWLGPEKSAWSSGWAGQELYIRKMFPLERVLDFLLAESLFIREGEFDLPDLGVGDDRTLLYPR